METLSRIKTAKDFCQLLEKAGVQFDAVDAAAIEYLFYEISFDYETLLKEGMEPEKAARKVFERHVMELPYRLIEDSRGTYVFVWRSFELNEKERELLQFLINNPEVSLVIDVRSRETPFLWLSRHGGDEDCIVIRLDNDYSYAVDYMTMCGYSYEYHLLTYNENTFLIRIEAHA